MQRESVTKETVQLKVRDWRFSTDVPTHWFAGRRALSRFFDNLSIFFPAGERFFIQSVKHYQAQITDPALRQSVDLFCAQEAMHNREHIAYNERLMREAEVVRTLDARVPRLLKRAKRRLTPRQQLAVTTALEHLTALMGHFVLSDERIFAGANKDMAALWRWHAAEENEHKAVAFDVYQAVGGTYAERCAIMVVTLIIFWSLVFEQQVRLMRHDGTLGSLREWADLVGHLFVNPGGFGKLGRMTLDYFRPDFHPWRLDNSALIASFDAQALSDSAASTLG